MTRRTALRLAAFTLTSVCARRGPEPAYALKPGKPSKESLLNSIHEEKTQEEIQAEKERAATERRIRLEKQRELQAASERRKAGFDTKKDEKEIESSLRGQYYFPTARKRYLPRVKLAYETIPAAETAARENDWRRVSELSSGVLSDAVLPMKLYASALAGGGLNTNTKFIDKMTKQAEVYEKALRNLLSAVKKKQSSGLLNHLDDMRGAIAQYRVLGHLEATDFGIGEIPGNTRVGSGFSNNNSALYRKNKGIQDQ